MDRISSAVGYIASGSDLRREQRNNQCPRNADCPLPRAARNRDRGRHIHRPRCHHSPKCNNRSWGCGHRGERCVVIGPANDGGARKSRPSYCHLWSSVGRKDKHGAVFALTAAIRASILQSAAIDMIGRRAGFLDRSTSCILGFMKALARGHGLRGLADTTKHLSS